MPMSNPLNEADVDGLVAGGEYQRLLEINYAALSAFLIGAFWGIKVSIA